MDVMLTLASNKRSPMVSLQTEAACGLNSHILASPTARLNRLG